MNQLVHSKLNNIPDIPVQVNLNMSKTVPGLPKLNKI